MGFKSDREFLRNISIGAIGTRQVASVLTAGGFNIIELERYSGSNKIWATKIKRLRVPDLLCLNTGTRIESRGKSKLIIASSHAENNPDRAWDSGLRDTDLIAFNRLWSVDDAWQASNKVALFRVGDMRAREKYAKLSQRKSASEGSEVHKEWPAIVPGSSGTVLKVESEKILTQFATGRKQTYTLKRKGCPLLTPHVRARSEFGEGDTVIASVIPTLVPPVAPNVGRYNFVRDLGSGDKATVYIAVKALGFLPAQKTQSVGPLTRNMASHDDGRVKLEAAASLARLGVGEGWVYLRSIARNPDAEPEYRMETALILAELPDQDAMQLLAELAKNRDGDSELRAAAAWGLASHPRGLDELLALTADADELTAVHSISSSARVINDGNIADVLRRVGGDDRTSAGVVRAILGSTADFVSETIKQLLAEGQTQRRRWLLYLIASAGRAKCEPTVQRMAPQLIQELEFHWTQHGDNWTNRLDVADQLNFLDQQTSKPLSR